MFERFRAETVEVVHAAVAEAQRRDDPMITTEHLLVGVATTPVGARLLGVGPDDVREARSARDRDALAAVGVDVELGIDAVGGRQRRRHRRFTGAAKAVLEEALHQAIRFRHRHIGIEHVVLALTATRHDDVVGLLKRLDVDADRLRAVVSEELRSAA